MVNEEEDDRWLHLIRQQVRSILMSPGLRLVRSRVYGVRFEGLGLVVSPIGGAGNR